MDVWLSDHQLKCNTRKVSRIKRKSHKQIKFCWFKQYRFDLFKQNYNDINEAYNHFIQKIMNVDKLAPIKERQAKQNSHKQFYMEIANEIKNRDKLFKRFKSSELYTDKDIITWQDINFRK